VLTTGVTDTYMINSVALMSQVWYNRTRVEKNALDKNAKWGYNYTYMKHLNV